MNTDAGQGQRPQLYIRIGRIFATILTLIAAVMMAFNKYTNISYSSSFGAINTNISVKATDSSSFVYFVIANSIVFVYSLVASVLLCIKRLGTGLVLPLAILDLLATIFLFTGSAAAAATEYVTWKGVPEYGWNKFCDITTSFCAIATAANAISLQASAIYFLIVLLSMISIHRRTSS